MKQRNKKLAKKQKARQRYQRELLRKPEYKREFVRSFPVVFAVFFLISIIVTNLAAASYIKSATNAINNVVSDVDETVTSAQDKYGEIDFNDVVLEGGNVYGPSMDKDDSTNKTLGMIGYKMDLFGMRNGNWENDLFSQIYGVYYVAKAVATKQKESDIYANPLYCTLYNTNGDLVYRQGNEVIQFVSVRKEGDKKTYFFKLDWATIEKMYPGFQKEYWNTTDFMKNGFKDIAVHFEDLYVKGQYVIPKKIEFVEYGSVKVSGAILYEGVDNSVMNDMEEIKGTVIKTYEFTDRDLEGYELYDTSDEDIHVLNPLSLNIVDENNPHCKAYESCSDADMQENIQKVADPNVSEEDTLQFSRYKAKGMQWSLTSNQSLVSVVAIDYDFFRDWKELLVLFYVINFFLTFLVTAIVARIRFVRKCVPYEVDSYRRKTTNAMAHDLKSPLMAISGYAENLVQNPNQEKVEYYAQNIQDTVKDMDQMIANILQLSKLEESKVKLKLEEVSLDALLQKQLEKYKDRLEERDLKVKVTGSATINTDIELMKHLLDNLISNAVKYSKEESEITITISDKELVVANPMMKELQVNPDTLMDAFVKGDNARNNTEGNGLGLSIVKNIADTLGYQVKLQVEGDQFIAKVLM